MSRRTRNEAKSGNTQQLLKSGIKLGSCCAIPVVGTVVFATKVVPKVAGFAKNKIKKNPG